jgi:UrcA family protein
MMNSKGRLFTAVCALPLAVLVPSAASAEDSNRDTVAQTVSYADLDLTLDTDQKRFERRLASALRQVCHPNMTTMQAVAVQRECLRQGKARNVQTVRLAVATRARLAKRA